MTNSRTTRKALLSSALALLMCVAMLIATTFAWFTDTASTSVNKIQAGTLDVKLYYEKDATASQEVDKWQELTDGSGSLGWVQATYADGTTTIIDGDDLPLWEPGCTFSLPRLKIVNEGNLDFKYKIVISGITGSAELTKAIEWKMKLGGENEADRTEVNFEALGKDHNLYAKSEGAPEANNYDIFTISGHMKDDAGNEYQGLSIDGIAITVYATQLASEFDSTTNQYDKDALYDLKIKESATGNLPVTQAAEANATVSEKTKISSGSVSVTYPVGVKLKSTTDVKGETDKKASVEQSLTFVDNKLSTAVTGVTLSTNQAVASYKLELPVDDNNTVLVPVEIDYEKNMTGLEVYHSGAKLDKKGAEDGDATDEYFTYDKSSGKLVLYLKHASPIDVVYYIPKTVSVNSVAEVNDAIKEGSSILLVNNEISVGMNTEGVTKTMNNTGCVALYFNKENVPNMADVITVDGDGTVKLTSKGMAVWAHHGANIVINGGTYDNSVVNSRWQLIYANNDSKITVNGGTFKANTKGELFNTSNQADGSGGTIIIKGGLYNKPLIPNAKGIVNGWQASDNYDENTGKGIKIADGYKQVEVKIDGVTWYKVVKDATD